MPLRRRPRTKLESLADMVQGVWSDDPALQLEATIAFRDVLSTEGGPSIDEVIETGVVPRLVEFLQRSDSPELQYDAGWALINVTAGSLENTQAVIECGAVPVFVQLLNSDSEDVREEAVWALGNVVRGSPTCRDLVLSHGALTPLLSHFDENSKISMLRNASWTLTGFCFGDPPVQAEQVRPAVAVLQNLIHEDDEEVLRNACRAIAHLSYGGIDRVRAMIYAGVSERLVELLRHPSPEVLRPILLTIANIAIDDDVLAQSVIDDGALACLHHLLTQYHVKSIKKRACWTVSTIAATTRARIQAVIDAGIIPTVMQLLQDAELDIKEEAAWLISNATLSGSHEQIQFLVSQGCIEALCDILTCPDPKVVTLCLDGLNNFLKAGGGVNEYADRIDECEGLDKIQQLTSHDDNAICEKAMSILESCSI